MTNADIIFSEALALMKQGIIGTTGRMMQVVIRNEAGEEEEIEISEPEPIHTYARWKELGYQVKKGEKAKAMIWIWKYSKSKNNEENEEEGEHAFKKKAYFFTIDQTEKEVIA